MSTQRIAKSDKTHNIVNMSYSTREEMDQSRAIDNSYEDLDKQDNNTHIYDVANVMDPTADVNSAKTVKSGLVAKGGNKFVKPNNGGIKETAPTPEAKLPRKTIVLLIVGTLLLCALISLLCGIIAYHVTTSKMDDSDGKQTGIQSSSRSTGGISRDSTGEMSSEITALKNNMSMLSRNMEKQGESLENSLAEIRDFLLLIDGRMDQLENALHQHKISNHSSGAITTTGRCQEGWVSYNGKCYFFSELVLDYNAAKEYCTRRSSDMVSISGPSENIFVKSVLKRMNASNHWLGMTDTEVEGHWVWNSGDPVTFTDWHRGKEPNGKENANCAVFWNLVEYQWADNPCIEKYSPLCEKNERPRRV